MFRGWFHSITGRPYVEADVVPIRTGRRRPIQFLVDTGADTTLLAPADARHFGLRPEHFSRTTASRGVGGTARVFETPAIVTFREAGIGLHFYALALRVLEEKPGMDGIPSLLGRDVLDRWEMVYAPANGLLSFEALTADGLLTNNGPV